MGAVRGDRLGRHAHDCAIPRGPQLQMKSFNAATGRGCLREAGFSLVEVMVALIVMSVGLLGIAKMQALALTSTTSARMRSIVALEASSLASTMRADRAYWTLVK